MRRPRPHDRGVQLTEPSLPCQIGNALDAVVVAGDQAHERLRERGVQWGILLERLVRRGTQQSRFDEPDSHRDLRQCSHRFQYNTQVLKAVRVGFEVAQQAKAGSLTSTSSIFVALSRRSRHVDRETACIP